MDEQAEQRDQPGCDEAPEAEPVVITCSGGVTASPARAGTG
jgi:hypothetical protein